MYEELIKRLRYAASYDERIVIQDCKEAADAIEELSRLHEAQRQNLITLMNEEPETEWIPVTERLPSSFQFVWAACKMEGSRNWTIETVYDPFLTCPWGHIPVLDSGKAIVYAWMDRTTPEPPKEE